MQYQIIGRSTLNVSRIGFGCMSLQPGQKDFQQLIDIAIDNGINYFDTADLYDKGLNEIQSDIFINKADQTEAIFDKFKAYFDEHYGSSQNQMGITAWLVKSEKFGDVKINLSDESADFTTDKAPGKISIWIYRDKE